MTKKIDNHTLVLVALLVALQIVFERLLSFGTVSLRVSMAFIPVAVAGMIYGPWGGGIVAVLADIVGMLLFSKGEVYFFPFSISEFLYGFGFGLFLNKYKLSLFRVSVCTALQFIVIDMFITSFWVYLYCIMIAGTPKGMGIIMTGRLAASAVNLPMQILGISLVHKYLKNPLKKLASSKGRNTDK